MTPGCSGTPLAKKLSLKDGLKVHVMAMPASVRAEIDAARIALIPVGMHDTPDAAHIFTDSRAALEDFLSIARTSIAQNGFVWVSWPKKASKVPTDITEDVLRDIALSLGLVDVKVCAIDATWSGLKLMIRKELRK